MRPMARSAASIERSVVREEPLKVEPSRAKSFCPCLRFAFAEGQTIFLFQFLADADIPLQPVAVGDAFAVVVHAVEDEVAMGIGFRSTWLRSSGRRR